MKDGYCNLGIRFIFDGRMYALKEEVEYELRQKGIILWKKSTQKSVTKKKFYIQNLSDGFGLGHCTELLESEVSETSMKNTGTLKIVGENINIGPISQPIDEDRKCTNISLGQIYSRAKAIHTELASETI